MMPKKPYLPNNWRALKETPDEYFRDPASNKTFTFEEFMDWKIAGWEIPSSVHGIIRERNLTTGKVSEQYYKRASSINERLKQGLQKGESEFVVCLDDAIVKLIPEDYEDYKAHYEEVNE